MMPIPEVIISPAHVMWWDKLVSAVKFLYPYVTTVAIFYLGYLLKIERSRVLAIKKEIFIDGAQAMGKALTSLYRMGQLSIDLKTIQDDLAKASSYVDKIHSVAKLKTIKEVEELRAMINTFHFENQFARNELELIRNDIRNYMTEREQLLEESKHHVKRIVNLTEDQKQDKALLEVLDAGHKEISKRFKHLNNKIRELNNLQAVRGTKFLEKCHAYYYGACEKNIDVKLAIRKELKFKIKKDDFKEIMLECLNLEMELSKSLFKEMKKRFESKGLDLDHPPDSGHPFNQSIPTDIA
jgi:chromosome segregation ATPase